MPFAAVGSEEMVEVNGRLVCWLSMAFVLDQRHGKPTGVRVIPFGAVVDAYV